MRKRPGQSTVGKLPAAKSRSRTADDCHYNSSSYKTSMPLRPHIEHTRKTAHEATHLAVFLYVILAVLCCGMRSISVDMEREKS
jgi:hypothetical protein